MPKLTIRKCPFTHQYFESDTDYAKHLRKLRKENTFARRVMIKRRSASTEVLNAMTSAKSVAEIERWVLNNFRTMMLPLMPADKILKCAPLLERFFLSEFRLEDLEYTESASNSHDAPRDGQTNWGGLRTKDGVPRGYPGLVGRIAWRCENTNPPRTKDNFWPSNVFSMSDVLRTAGIKCGSGGSGNGKVYGYDVRLFLQDFPALWEEIKMVQFQNRLAGTPAKSTPINDIIRSHQPKISR